MELDSDKLQEQIIPTARSGVWVAAALALCTSACGTTMYSPSLDQDHATLKLINSSDRDAGLVVFADATECRQAQGIAAGPPNHFASATLGLPKGHDVLLSISGHKDFAITFSMGQRTSLQSVEVCEITASFTPQPHSEYEMQWLGSPSACRLVLNEVMPSGNGYRPLQFKKRKPKHPFLNDDYFGKDSAYCEKG